MNRSLRWIPFFNSVFNYIHTMVTVYQLCELVLLKGKELHLFLVNLIVYGDVRQYILTMVDMYHIESSLKKNQANEIFPFSLLCNVWLKLWNIISTYWSKKQCLRHVQLYNVSVALW